MSIRHALSGLALLALGVAGLHPAPAAAAGKPESPVFHPPGRYYLALGDSLGFGFQHVRFDANYPAEPPSAFNSGYVDDLTAMLKNVHAQVTSVNYSCTDETSAPFVTGGCPYSATGA